MEKLPHFGNPVKGKTTVERKAAYRIQRRQRRRVPELLQMVSRNQHFLASARPRAVAPETSEVRDSPRPGSFLHGKIVRFLSADFGSQKPVWEFPPSSARMFPRFRGGAWNRFRMMRCNSLDIWMTA